MSKYILKRLLLMIPVIIGVVILVFTIMYLAPGDPAQVILGNNATDEALNNLREEMGLNDPYIVQLGRYMYKVFIRFDLGESLITGIPIMQEIITRFPRTLLLAATSITLAVILGVIVGVNAAVHQNSIADYGSMALAMIGVAMPGFWLALLLVLLFSYKLEILPAFGMGGVLYWIMPIVSNTIASMASMARQTRSSMLEVVNSDYIIMAKAKGLSTRKVIYLHALPNALIPVITIAGQLFGTMLGGALITETIFSIPGIGVYMVTAVNNRDYTVVQGGVIVLAIAFSALMLISDLVIAAVDPRIKAQFAGSGKRSKR